jgi:hypothetical protein
MRRDAVIDSPALERELLRKGVDHRTADRNCCHDCGRTPLVGEHVYRYTGGREVCELCRTLRREAPVASEPVYGSAHGRTVRITVRAA